eukprot:TRINITY_DN75289_c0_g1_i1.p1 TRINITY_DN75289_c0_g1~~TRINITY_DN75289_c0_g1_i1.p1  ORF type:complete len:380 (-),score=86.19 TRINITY_DN75289_c0_g1_i1:87-1226(-)
MPGGDPAAARMLAAAVGNVVDGGNTIDSGDATVDCSAASAKRQKVDRVPVIDLSPFFEEPGTDAGRDAVTAKVDRACEEFGFLVVTGHGIDPTLLKNCVNESKAFFAQPEEEKHKVAANGRAYGFFPLSSEALGYNADVAKRPDLREAFSMGPQEPLPPPGTAEAPEPSEVVDFCYQPTPWPEDCGLRNAMVQYYDAIGRLANSLVRIFARALRVDANFFLSKTTHHASSLRVVHYPKLEVDPLPGQLRCGEHSDICTMTILWQDVHGGLEVLPRGSDNWVEVHCPEDGLVVNLGDLLSRWTNDRWQSTPHRVVCPPVGDSERNVARISMPYFQILNSDAEVRCIESCLRPGEAAKYEPTTQGKDLMGHFKRWGRNRGE